MSAGRELVVLGVLGAPLGLRGELRARLHNPDSDLLRPGLHVYLRTTDGNGERRDVLALRRQARGFVVRLSGCEDRTAAEALAGAELCIERSALPPLEADEFYLCDLVGLEVRDAAGKRAGQVVDVIGYPASEVACVRTARGLFEVPLTPPYLVAAHPEQGELVIDLLDELDPVPEKG